MVYEIPRNKKSIKQNEYTVKVGDREYNLPLMGKIKPSVVLESQEHADELKQLWVLLEGVAPGLFDEFEDGDELGAFFKDWQKESGIEVGESEAS